MAKKIILALAPTGGWGKAYHNPVEPEEIALQVIACVEEGVSVVHLHARTNQGELTTDLSFLDKTVQLIKDKFDVILEASTGGLSDLTAQERALPLQLKPVELGSLNMGSLNFLDKVYINSLPDIRFWLASMLKNNVKPSMEIFDTSNVAISQFFIKEELIKPQFNFNFIFNYKWGMTFSPAIVELLKSILPEKSLWGAIIGSNRDFSMHIQAALKGAAMIRVGFEDSRICNFKEANSNIDLVKAIRIQLEKSGFELANPDESRKILNIS